MRQMDVKVDKEATAFDIQSMRELSDEQYAQYVEFEMFFVDHHDILRATHGEYPIATTAGQVRRLITYLQGVEARMRAAE